MAVKVQKPGPGKPGLVIPDIRNIENDYSMLNAIRNIENYYFKSINGIRNIENAYAKE
jgi:hypothetical protein